jgi:putative Holliday junction resolvase
MARILAIDYGKKRTGIAVSDPLKMIASGLTTVDTEKLVWFLKDYFSKEPVELILLGNPKRLDGTDNDITPKVEKFFGQLGKLFPEIPSKMIDERFTSKMAFQTMIDSGLKKKDRQNKGLVDEISATILLQGYLEFNS